jgi:putative transposase
VKGATTVKGLCRVEGISRQGYYRLQRTRQRQALDAAAVVDFVLQERALQPRLGGRKLHSLWQHAAASGAKLGRDRFFRVLRQHDLLVEPKRRSVRTTYHDPALPVYRNLLYQLEPTGPHQVWVSDITYVATQEGFLYLSLVTDLHSRHIVGWNVAQELVAAESIKALRMAIEQLPAGRWPIHHSDRGSQYCCHDYVAVLNERDLPISMTEQNHCYENCYAERVNGILKLEYNLDRTFRTKDQAKRAIAQSIWIYNHRRPHHSLKLRTPAQAHALAAQPSTAGTAPAPRPAAALRAGAGAVPPVPPDRPTSHHQLSPAKTTNPSGVST